MGGRAEGRIPLWPPPAPSAATVGWVLLPLRVFLGATFVFAGLQKLANPGFFDAANPVSIQAQLSEAAQRSRSTCRWARCNTSPCHSGSSWRSANWPWASARWPGCGSGWRRSPVWRSRSACSSP